MRFHRRAAAIAVALLTTSTAVAISTGPATASEGYVAVQPTDDAMAVAQAIATDPGTVSGASWVARPTEGVPTGVVNNPVTGFPTVGATAGILSTGDATIITQPNDSNSDGRNIGGGNVRGNTDRDVTILKIDFNVPANVNCLTSFDFRFLTEEYPEYVNSNFNDVYGV